MFDYFFLLVTTFGVGEVKENATFESGKKNVFFLGNLSMKFFPTIPTRRVDTILFTYYLQ